jgi:cytochrome bd-type quinol oxidase subunit 2
LPEDVRREPTGTGPGRLLVAVYAVFAVSAAARAGLQLATRFEDAPAAYLLSALAATVYVVATVALARDLRRLAWLACGFELAGVVVVGTVSLLVPTAFPDDTVWSAYGRGYAFIPMVLPVLGLWRLRRTAGPRVAQ